MKKAMIVTAVSLFFFIGIVAQTSARKIHCWDLNENYECDIGTKDTNGDGKCNPRDCETEEPCYTVSQTGQTVCYDTNGDIIDCPGTGQDGEYQNGTPWPEPRFTDNLDGTVTDHLTGLVWLQDASCFGTRTWQQALDDCNNLAHDSCGLTDNSIAGDWRLPNVRELSSLIDYGNTWPALPSVHPFSNLESAPYWTSTTDADADYTFNAWVVYTGSGVVGYSNKDNERCVWAVRNGN